ncbi:MAG: ATPase involved in chromosome partitioning [Mycobacterium sp.]|nr:ATPase involved in chromosome partitioning [Mycobacterium sp.]
MSGPDEREFFDTLGAAESPSPGPRPADPPAPTDFRAPEGSPLSAPDTSPPSPAGDASQPPAPAPTAGRPASSPDVPRQGLDVPRHQGPDVPRAGGAHWGPPPGVEGGPAAGAVESGAAPRPQPYPAPNHGERNDYRPPVQHNDYRRPPHQGVLPPPATARQQPPPPPSRRPRSERDEAPVGSYGDWGGGGGFSGAGAGMRDQLRAAELIAVRKIPSSRGWRKWLYQASFKKVNTGESADERELRRLNAAVATPLRGTYSMVVLGGKGGAGKTTTAAAIGSILAGLRNDKVVAMDADPAQAANLASRIDPTAASSFRDVLADEHLVRYSDMRSHVGQNDPGLDVLASNQALSGRQPMDTATYTEAHQVLQRFYSLLIADCGVDQEHAVMAGVLDTADTVVMVASAVPDGAEGADKVMRWLSESGYRQLGSRMVLVVNHIRGYTSRRDRKESERLVATLVERFSRWVPVERIFVIPFDRHIATAGVIDLDQLRPQTRRRFLELTATVATGFTATTDAP